MRKTANKSDFADILLIKVRRCGTSAKSTPRAERGAAAGKNEQTRASHTHKQA